MCRFCVSVMLGLLGLASCSPQPTAQQAHGLSEIVVGHYGSFTGSTAALGISMRNGVEMATDEVNQAGGITGRTVKLVVVDDEGKPEEAQAVVARLISEDKVVAVLGEVASSRSLAAAPVCQQNHIPMITPYSTDPRVTKVGDFIFRACFIDSFQGFVLAKFAVKSLMLKKLAILRDKKNNYSTEMADVFQNSLEKLGGEITADESYGEGDKDFTAQLLSIQSKNPEGIFIPGYYTEVGLIARQARLLGLSVPLLGGDGWDSPRLWDIGGEALNGAYFSNHFSSEDPNPVIQRFSSEYRKRFNSTPEAAAALGYDSARILFDSIRRAGSTEGARIRAALAAVRQFPGVTGRITINGERNAIKPAVILRIQDGKFIYQETIIP